MNYLSLWRLYSYTTKVYLRLFIKTFKELKSRSINSLDNKHDYSSKTYNIFNPK
jgi:hypothetical protein